VSWEEIERHTNKLFFYYGGVYDQNKRYVSSHIYEVLCNVLISECLMYSPEKEELGGLLGLS
jgi:hypothetical protein